VRLATRTCTTCRPYLGSSSSTGRHAALRLSTPDADETALSVDALAGAAYVRSAGSCTAREAASNVLPDPGRCVFYRLRHARTIDATAMTGTAMTIGTAAYLAPEQARGDEVTSAADVYSLGLVLLECRTGVRAFPGSPVEAAVARLSRDPEIPASLEPEWRALLSAMTAREPSARPTAAELAANPLTSGDAEATVPIAAATGGGASPPDPAGDRLAQPPLRSSPARCRAGCARSLPRWQTTPLVVIAMSPSRRRGGGDQPSPDVVRAPVTTTSTTVSPRPRRHRRHHPRRPPPPSSQINPGPGCGEEALTAAEEGDRRSEGRPGTRSRAEDRCSSRSPKLPRIPPELGAVDRRVAPASPAIGEPGRSTLPAHV
jgi:serine/threonine protein kinase